MGVDGILYFIQFNSIYYVSIPKGLLSFHLQSTVISNFCIFKLLYLYFSDWLYSILKVFNFFLTSTYTIKVKRCLSLPLFSAAFCYFETMMFFPELVKKQLTAEDQKGATFFVVC